MAPQVAPESLAPYNAKRDFARTLEPPGELARRGGQRFVVQKHAATRLHYDFRLELDGVLLSWAVTRGPSLDPAQKRLAVRTEDHPVAYAGFEGTIPEGEYGGGTVMLWDRGTWVARGEPHAGLRAGKLRFELRGERLRGEWLLVRMRGPKRESWLLRKIDDEEAGEADALTENHLTSIETGRSLEEIAAARAPPRPGAARRAPLARSSRRRRQKAIPVGFRPLQLATLVDAPPAGREWLHETKLDGYRCLVARDGGRITVYTRYGKDWSARFEALVAAAAQIPATRLLLDGEVVVLDARGRSDFAKLQNAMREDAPLDFYAFDLLLLEGEDLTALPLLERKSRLEALLRKLPKRSRIHFSAHTVGGGVRALESACRQGHEGIVSKRADAPYVGKRSDTWLKVKCLSRQEFVIIGWTPSTRREGFASLILGLHEGGRLRYAGRVGTGFTTERIAGLAERLAPLAARQAPVTDAPGRIARTARWVRPELVAEIDFTGFTRDRIARHPSFVALREDKPPEAITAETPRSVREVMGARRPAQGTPAGAAITRHGVRITNPGRLQYADAGISKGDLVDYYERVAECMLPHLRARPLTLIRCPRGVGQPCFVQQHAAAGFPRAVHRVRLTETSGKVEDHFYVDDLAGILGCVQMGVLEFHAWGSRAEALESPDRLVFDLDPDPALPFVEVIGAARLIRERLAADAIESWPLLSGGKGIHVVASLAPTEWRTVSAYAKRLAMAIAGEQPRRFTAGSAKAERGGRIFIDYLRNERGITTIAPYSTRARPGAPVAMPLDWDAVEDVRSAGAFTVRRVLEEGLPKARPPAKRAAGKQSLP